MQLLLVSHLPHRSERAYLSLSLELGLRPGPSLKKLAGASFTSTASSQDLTAHPRANASFDQVIGLGAGGHGIGRFNAGKLNAYLHGLNRRLQEESESLTGHVGLLRRENLALAGANAVLQEEMEQFR